jgi:hypothetical protein
MKTCGRCQQPEVIGQNGKCNGCNRFYARQNYAKNKEKYTERTKKRNTEVDDFINSFKSKPCIDCGISYPPYVMDFDHLGDKVAGICTMRRRRMSLETIQQEIAKCELVCSNCHRVRTNTRRPPRYDIKNHRLQPVIL